MGTDYSDDQRPSPTDEIREYDYGNSAFLGQRTFVLTITTDYADAENAARRAARKVVNEIGWGDDNTSSFELVEQHLTGPPTYLAGWEFEPGEQSGYEDMGRRALRSGLTGAERAAATKLAEQVGSPDHPDRLMQRFLAGARGEADIDMVGVLWDVFADVRSSYRLALEEVGMNDVNIEAIDKTVEDYLTNHYGDD